MQINLKHEVYEYFPLVIKLYWLLGCNENIKNHIFYYFDSNYGALTNMEKESEEKNPNFSWVIEIVNFDAFTTPYFSTPTLF